ncbi:MAG TPA: MMPL family transporter [Bacillota bacterium]|nr:MMPL family transporter [Bacillota bacterium]
MRTDRLTGLGQWLVRHRVAVLIVWIILLLTAVYFSPKVERVLQGAIELTGSQSELVSQILQKEFGNRYNNELILVFYSPTRTAADDAYREAVEAIQLKLRDYPKINNILTYYDSESEELISSDQHSMLGVVELDVNNTYAAQQAIPKIRQSIIQAGIPSWLKVYTVGEGAVTYDLVEATGRDLIKAESYSFPVIIIILVFTFGALLAAGIPVILGAFSVVIALGLMYFIGQGMPMFVLAKNAVSMIGLGVGIDYSLFMVSRFREELSQGRTPQEAAAAIMTTSGRTVLFAGFSVIVGISALFVTGVPFLNSLAISMIAVVVVAIAAALTLLPVLLSWFGKRIDWPGAISNLIQRSSSGDFWRRIATKIMKRPVLFFLFTLILLLGLTYPILHLRTYTPTVVGLPQGVESRLGFERLQSDFVAGKMAPINLIIQAPPGQKIWSRDAISRIYRLSRRISANPQVSKVESIVDVDPELTLKDYLELYCSEGGLSGSENIFAQMVSSYTESNGQGVKTLMRVTTVAEPGSIPSRAVVQEIRGKLSREIFKNQGYQIWVGGGAAREVDLDEVFLKKLPIVIGMICIITLIILILLFRSIAIPLKSVFMNLLSVMASFGFLVLVFQDGLLWFTGLKAPGGISSVILLILFAVLFGLSMDYEIFITLRIKEEHDHGRNNEESVARGLMRTGGLVTSAASIMVTVFGSFALTSLMTTQEIGLGLAAAVFLDATIIRILLMPATMRLLGEWNWWFPKKLDRLLPKINMKE